MLGSGGARGHAHIGVIRAIEEAGYDIRGISGASMGSVIGGVYAADKLETYCEWAYELTRSDVIKLLDFSFSWESLFKGERIINVMRDLLGEQDIESLDRSFTAVATSLHDQREVWINKGSLFRAIRASCAVPGVFSPVKMNGDTLVDGGLVNPIPIAPTMQDGSDITIAVNLAGLEDGYKPPQKEDTDRNGSNRDRITRFISSLFGDGGEESAKENIDMSELLVKSFDVMQSTIARLKFASYAPDITIEIPKNACTFFEFHRAKEMTELGYERARKALELHAD